jgi:phage/plasmid primase-like uncharacterized protein
MINREDAFRQFLAVMATRNLALTPGKQLVADGEWQRCTATNKSQRNSDGSYRLQLDGAAPWGLVHNWTDGKKCEHWRGERHRALTDAELADLERRTQEALIEAEAEAIEAVEAAAATAKDTWQRLAEAPDDHPYLLKKGIKAHGTRISADGQLLLVPMYDPNGDLVNLQHIAASGSKWFLRGGRASGCCFPIPRDGGTADETRAIVCEGFATGATITEATPYHVGVAFSASNLPAIASNVRQFLRERDDLWWRDAENRAAESGLVHDHRPERSVPIGDPEVVIAADDDYQTKGNPGIMKALAAARVASALIAVPRFDDPRPEGATDFNDLAEHHGLDPVREDIDNAVQPQALLEQRLLADPHSAHGDAMVAELAAWQQQDRPYYEQLLGKLKKVGVRLRELDQQVKKSIEVAAAKAAAARERQRSGGEEVDAEALAQSAAPIIASQNVLDDFAKAHGRLYVGEKNNAKLLYLICTSRLFDLQTTMHGAIKGPSAVGKSALMGSVCAFMPPESVFRFTSLSERALLYLPDGGNLAEKILVMAEAPKDEKQQEMQNLLLRELMSEGVLRYPVVQKTEGGFETVTIEVRGPVSFLMSTTKTEINDENETRMLSIELDDSKEQTKAVMLQVARREGFNFDAAQINFTRWHDFQRWLAAGERRVHINYATDLATLIPAKAVRLRRDMGQLLRAIKAYALLHREHRKPGERTGAIMATFDDYKAVRELMVDPISEAAEVKARKTLPDTVAAVRRAQPPSDSGRQGATINEIAAQLDIDRTATKRRIDHAMRAGHVALLEARHGRAFLYATVTGATIAEDTALLPTVEAVRAAFRERTRQARQQSSSRTPPDSPAQLHSSRLRR